MQRSVVYETETWKEKVEYGKVEFDIDIYVNDKTYGKELILYFTVLNFLNMSSLLMYSQTWL